MLVKNVIRGNTLTFTTTFYDANNNVVTPQLPVLTVYYKSNNQYITVTANLVQSGNSWAASWSSANADVGLVEWYISGGPGTNITDEGSFRVLSNKANGGPFAS